MQALCFRSFVSIITKAFARGIGDFRRSIAWTVVVLLSRG